MNMDELVALRLKLNEANSAVSALSATNVNGMTAEQRAQLDVAYSLACKAQAALDYAYRTAIDNFTP
jgi:hypothetical protein